MKQKILKELATWNFDLLAYAMRSQGCKTLNQLVQKVHNAYFDDIRTLKADYEYAMKTEEED